MSSSLIVEVCQIDEVKAHENADSLELITVKGWQSVVKKDMYKKGDKIIFIPPDALIPDNLADSLNLRPYLTGPNKDRVKCVRLRGEMSFGLVINIPEGKNWEVGYDCADDLGITKYIPPVRDLIGDMAPEDPYFGKYTDMENGRNFPNVFTPGEMVVATEKIDGSNDRIGISISTDENGNIFYEWKAGSHKVKRKRPEDISQSIYWLPYSNENVRDLISYLHEELPEKRQVILFGEIYGKSLGGMKELNYGKPSELDFRAFDIKINDRYINYSDFKFYCDKFNVKTVPLIDIFHFSFEKCLEASTGDSILAKENGATHIREGAVIKPIEERIDPKIGRVILKVLNNDYLLLKNKKQDKGQNADYTDY